jgi:hypothetical protein
MIVVARGARSNVGLQVSGFRWHNPGGLSLTWRFGSPALTWMAMI